MMDGWLRFRTGDDEVASRLEAYARVALASSADGRDRVRAAVMAEAQRRLAGSSMARAGRVGGANAVGWLSPRRWNLRLGLRRPAMGFAAALLAIAALAGGTVAASPGGPLYGARVWVETLTLPTDASARTDAEVVRLNARLADAQTSEAAGNGPAVQAALDAYRSILDEAMAAAGNDLTLQAKLELVLERHVVVLQAIQQQAADRGLPSAGALADVISRSEARIEEFVQDHPGQPAGPAQGVGNGAGSSNAPGANGQGNGPGASNVPGANGQGNGPGSSHEPGSGNGQGAGQGNGPNASHQPGSGDKPAPTGKGHVPQGQGSTSNGAAAQVDTPSATDKPGPSPRGGQP